MKNNIESLHQQDKIIDYHRGLQDLLISISTKYINADLSNIDDLIESSLAQIGESMGADRSYVFSYDFKNNTTSNTHEWCNDGIEPTIHQNQNIPLDFMGHLIDIHSKGEVFIIEDVGQMSDEGGEMSLKSILESQSIKSLIIIPKIRNGELRGFVGFDSVKRHHKYTEREKDILFVFSNMLTNINQRKNQEYLIREQSKKTEELLKNLSIQNEKLNEYAHVVSHDLKSPLINIHNLVEWFIEDNKESLGDSGISLLKQVLFNVEKMDFLIKGILDYSLSRETDVKEKDIDINILIEEVLKTMFIPEKVTISVQENLPKIKGNHFKFNQLFQNLIQNAIKFNDKEKGIVEIGCSENKHKYQFFVKDNGVGIHQDYFEKIFKVFSKLESTSTSSGIGLSIVKKVVEFYKGKIWLESEENKGTTFYFTISKN